jgi:hypothetical protein
MNWKRTFAFLVAVLFLLSIPAVFAENADRIRERTDAQGVQIDEVSTDSTAGAVDADDAEAGNAETGPNLIAPSPTVLKQAKERFEAAKQQYATARAQYAEAKQSIEQNRDRLRECKEEATDECKLIVKGVKKDVKDFLLGAADRILASLEKVKSKVEESSMNEETKTKILAKIDERIAAVTAAKEKIDALTETSTKAEIKEATAGLRGAWNDSKADIKLEAGRLANEKIHGIIVKSEQLKTKLETTMTKLSDKGYDVSGLEELRASFDAKLAEAKTHYDAAFAKYGQEVVPGEVDALMKEANAEMKLAQKALQDAHKILKDIVAEIKGTQEKGIEKKEEKLKENKTEELKEENETPENETPEAEQPEVGENETEAEQPEQPELEQNETEED